MDCVILGPLIFFARIVDGVGFIVVSAKGAKFNNFFLVSVTSWIQESVILSDSVEH